jgi:putative tricarboxylic transport membrane protein
MFAGFGLFFVAWSFAHYQMGSAVRMGPGYFPAVLGGLLVLLGLGVLLQSMTFDGPKVEAFHFKPLIFVCGSVLAYGYLMQPGGLAVATAAAVIIGAMAGNVC